MPFFDPVTIPALLIMAASPVCTMPKATEISVVPVSAPIIYDYSKSLRELQGVQSDTINPYDFDTEVRTQGLMSGSLQIEPQVHIGWQEQNRSGAVCAWYDKIEITLKLAPTVVLGREVYHDPCMKKAVLGHEMKHVNIDRQLVNKYSEIMGERVHVALQEQGFVFGPGWVDDLMSPMQNIVFQVVTREFHKLEAEQLREQQKIDSRAEYDRVSRLCPDFQRKYTVRRAYREK